MKPKKSLKPEFKVAEEFLDLKSVDTNVFVEYLEDQIKLREMPIDKRFKKLVR
jgi:hypothetical protein